MKCFVIFSYILAVFYAVAAFKPQNHITIVVDTTSQTPQEFTSQAAKSVPSVERSANYEVYETDAEEIDVEKLGHYNDEQAGTDFQNDDGAGTVDDQDSAPNTDESGDGVEDLDVGSEVSLDDLPDGSHTPVNDEENIDDERNTEPSDDDSGDSTSIGIDIHVDDNPKMNRGGSGSNTAGNDGDMGDDNGDDNSNDNDDDNGDENGGDDGDGKGGDNGDDNSDSNGDNNGVDNSDDNDGDDKNTQNNNVEIIGKVRSQGKVTIQAHFGGFGSGVDEFGGDRKPRAEHGYGYDPYAQIPIGFPSYPSFGLLPTESIPHVVNILGCGPSCGCGCNCRCGPQCGCVTNYRCGFRPGCVGFMNKRNGFGNMHALGSVSIVGKF